MNTDHLGTGQRTQHNAMSRRLTDCMSSFICSDEMHDRPDGFRRTRTDHIRLIATKVVRSVDVNPRRRRSNLTNRLPPPGAAWHVTVYRFVEAFICPSSHTPNRPRAVPSRRCNFSLSYGLHFFIACPSGAGTFLRTTTTTRYRFEVCIPWTQCGWSRIATVRPSAVSIGNANTMAVGHLVVTGTTLCIAVQPPVKPLI